MRRALDQGVDIPKLRENRGHGHWLAFDVHLDKWDDLRNPRQWVLLASSLSTLRCQYLRLWACSCRENSSFELYLAPPAWLAIPLRIIRTHTAMPDQTSLLLYNKCQKYEKCSEFSCVHLHLFVNRHSRRAGGAPLILRSGTLTSAVSAIASCLTHGNPDRNLTPLVRHGIWCIFYIELNSCQRTIGTGR